jgi:hypothetical protein
MSRALTVGEGKCQNVSVTTQDGRVYNLGSPDSRLFPLRRRIYLFKRRKEM